MMSTLTLKYRSFDGFERSFAQQTAHFARLNPQVAFQLSHAGPEELHAEMIGHNGVHSGSYDLMEVIEDVHTGADTLPALPEYPAMNEIFNQMSWAAVQGQKSVEQALSDAAKACEDLLAGYYL
jgi:maltose-binding protein MalE